MKLIRTIGVFLKLKFFEALKAIWIGCIVTGMVVLASLGLAGISYLLSMLHPNFLTMTIEQRFDMGINMFLLTVIGLAVIWFVFELSKAFIALIKDNWRRAKLIVEGLDNEQIS